MLPVVLHATNNKFMQADQSSRESIFASIRQWQSSGLSQKSFCKANQIRYHVFHYWYRVFKDTSEQNPSTVASFVRVHVPPVSTDLFADVSFPVGSKVTFYQPVSSEYLKSLL
jgi:hypothetical protein